MSHNLDTVESLRASLAHAERARDEALTETAVIRRRWQDEHREGQRRLRNMFSVIRIVARRSADDADTVEDYCGLLDGRLSSYLATQAALMQDWMKGSNLALLIAGELLTFGLKDGEQVELDGPPISLTSSAAGVLVFAFHELASGAIMSGRFDAPEATLHVRWRVDEEPEPLLVIDWSEVSPNTGRDEEKKSSWAEWVDQAIEHQLAGTTHAEMASGARTTRFSLPISNTC